MLLFILRVLKFSCAGFGIKRVTILVVLVLVLLVLKDSCARFHIKSVTDLVVLVLRVIYSQLFWFCY